MFGSRKVITRIAVPIVVLAGAGAGIAIGDAPTTGTSTVCATATTPNHVLGVDGLAVYTVPGDSNQTCTTATYTIPTDTTTNTVTSPPITVTQTTTVTVTGTTTTPPPPPPPAQPFWNGDYSTGDWTQYDDCNSAAVDGKFPADYAIDTASGGTIGKACGSLGSPQLVHDITPPAGFQYAGRYTVRSGNASYEGEAGERSLDTLWPDSSNGTTGKSRAYEGATTWYRDEVYFPAGFAPTRSTDWNWVYEIHNYPDSPGDAMLELGSFMDTSDHCGSANVGLGRLSTQLQGGSTSKPTFGYLCGPSIQTGHWYDVVYQVHWDNTTAGSVTEWIDGNKIGTYNGPTLYTYNSKPGQGYVQHGYYRPTDAEAGYAQPTDTVYHAATMDGPTAASIGENLP